MPTEEKIKCTLNTIIFQKDDFIIASFDLVDDNQNSNKETFDPFEDYELRKLNDFLKTSDTIKAKGTIVSLQQGVIYTLSGVWENHPRYGKSLKINDYEVEMPSNTEDIISYLSSYGVGIGPITARRIVDLFGVDTLKVIKETPIEELKEKIGDRRFRQTSVLEKLKEKLIEIENGEQRYLQSKSVFKNTNLGKRTIDKILETFKGSFVDVIKSNPYALINDDRFSGVGFKTAEQIAVNVKFDLNSDLRFQSAIIFTMQEFVQNGSCFIKEDVLENLINSRYNLDRKRVKECFNKLVENKKLVIDEEKVYLQNIWYYEDFVAKKIVELSKQKCRLVAEDININELKEDQRLAFEVIKNNNVTVLTGPPGCGKSFLLKFILDMFNKYNCLLVAPTGIAAYRMSELSGRPASTIHKALSPMKNEITGKFEFTINEQNKLTNDFIVIDESSMVDIGLAYYLLSSIPNDSKILIVGDHCQLPSVGPGNLLCDIINSRVIPVVELTEIKRQDKVGLIIENCSRIKNGLDIIRDNSKDSDMFLINIYEEQKIVEEIVGLVSERLKKVYPNLSLNDFQILACHNEKTLCSVENINNILQEKLNGCSPYLFKSKYKISDKIIQLRNDYQYDPPLLNGLTGIIKDGVEEFDKNGKMTQFFVVKFSDREQNELIPVKENNIKLNYIATSWKFQGQECKIVIIPVLSNYAPMLAQRNWLYTSISRGKSMVIIVGHVSEIKKIIDRTWAAQRNTYLLERLKKYDKEYCDLQKVVL